MLWVETIEVEELDFGDKKLSESSSNVVHAMYKFFNRRFVLSWMEIENNTILIAIHHKILKIRGFNLFNIH